MIKLSDFVMNFLVDHGVTDVFLVTGGGAAHLDDSIGRNPKLKYICNHHEQASSFAVEGYSRATQNIGACVVTTGPGSTNAITGLISTWLDSIPALFISGQVKRSAIKNSPDLRQLGDQEINIIDLVTPVTKYAVTVMDPLEIRYHLEKAYYLATNSRPGPTWINIPFDVQGTMIDEEKLKKFDPKECPILFNYPKIGKQIEDTIQSLKRSQRPVLLVGKGIHLAHAENEFRKLVEKLKIPVLTSLTGCDLIEENHPCYRGRQGLIGQRRGNFVAQNADVILAIGTRLNIRMVSYNPEFFAREAKKIVVDIDPAELRKPLLKIDVPICADAKFVMQQMLNVLGNDGIGEKEQWWHHVNRIFTQYPPTLKEYYNEKEYANLYVFNTILSNALKGGEIIVSTNGFASIGLYESFEVKTNQKIMINSGCASMGYGLPCSIGACAGNKYQPVYCIEGDGSLQMNIQELQTLKHYNLPIKLFVINNEGYLSIKETQKGMFNGRYMGSNRASGVSTPSLEKIAAAYGLDYLKIRTNSEIMDTIKKVIAHEGPIICEVMTNPEVGYSVKVSSFVNKKGILISRPLEDMSPLLPRDEFRKNMLIKPVNDEES